MNDKSVDSILYFIGIFVGIFIGSFITYMGYIKHNLLLPEEKYVCVGAEPTGSDPSIVACTIFLRKDSNAHKKFLEIRSDESV